MTTLTLVELWVAPVGDLTNTLQLRTRTEDETVQTPTEVRRYAGGRDRVITRPGTTRRLAVTCLNVDRDDYLELLSRQGTVQLFREPRGRRIYGVLSAVTGEEWRAREDTLGTVGFTITESSYIEAV